MPYDPEAVGARCKECWLYENREGGPVPSEILDGAEAVVVGEAPGADEVERGAPFVGKSGNELFQGLGTAGIRRGQVNLINSVACQPLQNNYDLMLHRIKRANKKTEKQNTELAKLKQPLLPLIPDPAACCRPRFLHDLSLCGSAANHIIAAGGKGAAAVLDHPISIMEARGGPITVQIGEIYRQIMPVLHPAFVMRKRRWTRAFRIDLGRAIRWFRGHSGWRQPKVTFNPSPRQLQEFLTRYKHYAYDTETKSPIRGRPELAKDPLLAVLGLLGIATEDEVMVISFLGVDGETRFYGPAELEQIKEIVRVWAAAPDILKSDHNGYYDVPVLKWNIGAYVFPRLDNILQHRVVEPELPHGLGYVASTQTEIPYAWKQDHSGTDSETDDEWRTYNSIDCVLTFRETLPLHQQVVARQQSRVLGLFHSIQTYCMGLHENGLWINQKKRQEWDDKLRGEALKHIADFRGALTEAGMGESDARAFNPGSYEQLKQLFFDRWGFTPVEYSKKTGEPSTGDDSIREWMRDVSQPESRKKALKLLRRVRNTIKLRGTYVRKMVHYLQPVPPDPLARDADLIDEDGHELDETDGKGKLVKEKKRKKGRGKEQAYGLVLGDGRVHSHFNSHSVKCVAPETYVLTANGPRWMANVGDFGKAGEERPPALGTRLHDGDGLREVSHLVNSGIADRIEAKTVLGLRLIGTPWHRVQVAKIEGTVATTFRKRQYTSREHPLPAGVPYIDTPLMPAWEWRSLGALKAGEYVRVPIGMNAWGSSLTPLPKIDYTPTPGTNANEITLPTEITEDLAFFAGAYTADGSLHDFTDSRSFSIRISNYVRHERKKLTEAVAVRLFGRDAVRVDAESVSVTSVALREWAKVVEFGRTLRNKRAPSWILRAPWPIVSAYIKGCAFDSHFDLVGSTTQAWIYTGSKLLCEEMQMLLLNRGIPASLQDRRVVGGEQSWSCFVYGARDVAAVCEITGQTPPPAPDVIPRPKYFRRGNVLWLRVMETEQLGPGPVLDVTIPETHAFWSNGFVSHNTGSRLSSDSPNVQNWQRKLRNMVAPFPGVSSGLLGGWLTHDDLKNLCGPMWSAADPLRVFIYADEDQLEMRMVAALAGMARLLDAFATGKDPHALNGVDFFGAEFINAMKLKDTSEEAFKRYDRLRDFSKTAFYALCYGATFETFYETLTSAEDANGNLPFVHYTKQQVRATYDNYLKRNPELVKWWAKELHLFKYGQELTEAERAAGVIQQGPLYLADCLYGFRMDFLDGDDSDEGALENRINNARAQCVPSFTRVLTQDGYVPIAELVGKSFTAWTGKRWAKATALQKGMAELQSVYTDRGTLYCDNSHKLLTPMKEARYDWRRVDSLQQNQRVAMDLARPLEFGQPGDEEDAYHLGLYLADGSATIDKRNKQRESSLQFAVCMEQGDGVNHQRGGLAQIERLKAWGKKMGLGEPSIDEHEGCYQVTFWVGGMPWLASWGADHAEKAHSKRVPERIWRSSLAVRKAFLRGFLDGDGRIDDKGGRVVIRLCQKRLLEELRLLARTVGVVSGDVHGPMKSKSDKTGKTYTAFAIQLCTSQVYSELGWGRPARLSPSQTSPWWVAKGALSDLTPTCASDVTLIDRIENTGRPVTNPYVLTRMGAKDLYDHATVKTPPHSRRLIVPVYTLMVDDEDHSYVAEGFISHNSTGGFIVQDAAVSLTQGPNAPLPFGRYGHGTGMVNQGHDRLDFEWPTFHPRRWADPKKPQVGWCEPGCTCLLEKARLAIGEAMTRKGSRRVPGLAVDFTSKASVVVGAWT